MRYVHSTPNFDAGTVARVCAALANDDAADKAALIEDGVIFALTRYKDDGFEDGGDKTAGHHGFIGYLPDCGRLSIYTNGNAAWFDSFGTYQREDGGAPITFPETEAGAADLACAILNGVIRGRS